MRNTYNIILLWAPIFMVWNIVWNMTRKKTQTPWMRIFRSFTAKTLQVNWVEKKNPSYFMVKRASVYLLPQYKPWWALWQSGLGVSLAGCGAALHPASCNPQDLGICRRSPGNTLTFIPLENRSSAIKKPILWMYFILWKPSRGAQTALH